MRFNGESIDRSYPGDVFQVTGGKGSIRKAIQQNFIDIKHVLTDDYNEAVARESIKIKHIYIKNIKEDLTDFKDIKF